MSWLHEVSIKDICDLITVKTNIKNASIKNYISTENMLPNFGGVEHAEKLPSSNTVNTFIHQDVLFSNIRTYFKKVWFSKFNGTASADVLVFRAKDNCDSKFLYYLMCDPSFIEYTVLTSKGAKMPRGDKDAIFSYTVSLPSIQEQKAITSVLSSIDDKLDLLHRQNKTLESMAETMFRQWFIVNEQEQWVNGTIEDLYVLQRGFDLPSNQRVSGKFNLYAASGLNDNINSYKVDYPTIITGRSGVIGKVYYSLEKSWPLNTTLYIKVFKIEAFWFAYFHLKTLDLASLNSGSAVPTLNRNHVHSLTVKIPPNKLISKFEDDASVFMIKFNENIKQILNLEKLRDTLLPKLMSGEVRVQYAEQAIASVA